MKAEIFYVGDRAYRYRYDRCEHDYECSNFQASLEARHRDAAILAEFILRMPLQPHEVPPAVKRVLGLYAPRPADG